MRFLAVVVFACLAACALASGYGGYYRGGYGGPGLRRGYGGVRAPYNNAARQEAVNDKAAYAGAGTGTEEYDGVPGTGLDFGYGYGYRNGYGYGGYGRYGGYPYGGY